MYEQTTQSKIFGSSPLSLLRAPKKNDHKVSPNKQRKIQGITLKKLELMQSYHQSVVFSSRNSSMRNAVNSTLFNNSQAESDFSVNNNLQNFEINSLLFPTKTYIKKDHQNKVNNQKNTDNKIRNSSLSIRSMSDSKFKHKKSQISTQKQSPDKHKLPNIDISRETTIVDILKKFIDTNFIQSLMLYMNKNWEEQQSLLLKEKRFQSLRNLITQKTNFVNQLIQDFMTLQYEKYDESERKVVISLLFKQSTKILKGYDSLFLDILKKIPEDKIVKQESEIEGLHAKILQIFDPKYINSSQKMKDRMQLFMGGYTSQKNNLLASIVTKLKPHLDFINQIESYLSIYQKEIIKIRNQLHNSQVQKNNIHKLLNKKVNFTPIQIDYEKLLQLKEDSKRQFFEDLDTNFIKFHQQMHKKSDKIIKRNQDKNERLYLELQQEKQKNQALSNIIYDMKNSQPKKQDSAVQVHLLNSKKNMSSVITNSIASEFLQNISTPFSFTQKVTGSLVNLLTIDKVLYDFQVIKNKFRLNYFSDFMVQWFVIRTGSKNIAQIFAKNFMYSIKQLKNRHKRFNLFSKFCGFNGFRKKNIIEDLQYIFFQTHRAWYLFITIALKYRKKICQNPTGYHLLPPLQCENIFKLPLRKVYEIIQQILTQQQIQIPENFTNKVDHYAINQICKFKQNDEKFQKEQLQQIHILQNINFDIIAGFIIELIAKQKCSVVQKFLRAVTLKQKQMGDVLGYSQFESIYRKFYKQKRSKVQLIYSKICLLNQNDLLNIENAEPIIRAILQNQSGLRNIFDENQTLKSIILTEKSAIKADKKNKDINSYENFRERFYFEFYDFYNTTGFLEEVYRIIKNLIKTKLKSFIKDQKQLEEMIQQKQPLHFITAQQQQINNDKKEEQSSQNSDDEDQYDDEQEENSQKPPETKQLKSAMKKNDLESKVEEWNKIVVRIPHFSKKVLTVDQIIVHNMRRKQMIDASQFAWRTLRDILILISKQ